MAARDKDASIKHRHTGCTATRTHVRHHRPPAAGSTILIFIYIITVYTYFSLLEFNQQFGAGKSWLQISDSPVASAHFQGNNKGHHRETGTVDITLFCWDSLVLFTHNSGSSQCTETQSSAPPHEMYHWQAKEVVDIKKSYRWLEKVWNLEGSMEAVIVADLVVTSNVTNYFFKFDIIENLHKSSN